MYFGDSSQFDQIVGPRLAQLAAADEGGKRWSGVRISRNCVKKAYCLILHCIEDIMMMMMIMLMNNSWSFFNSLSGWRAILPLGREGMVRAGGLMRIIKTLFLVKNLKAGKLTANPHVEILSCWMSARWERSITIPDQRIDSLLNQTVSYDHLIPRWRKSGASRQQKR